jgi:hypothetical protein
VHAENPSECDESDQRCHEVDHHENRQLHHLADRRVEPVQHEQRPAGDRQTREGMGSAAPVALVETLLDRGTDDDLAEADAAIERLAAAPADEGLVIRDIWLLRLRALQARAHGDEAAHANLRDRYRDMARTLGFEGHIAWAEAMP